MKKMLLMGAALFLIIGSAYALRFVSPDTGLSELSKEQLQAELRKTNNLIASLEKQVKEQLKNQKNRQSLTQARLDHAKRRQKAIENNLKELVLQSAPVNSRAYSPQGYRSSQKPLQR